MSKFKRFDGVEHITRGRGFVIEGPIFGFTEEVYNVFFYSTQRSQHCRGSNLAAVKTACSEGSSASTARRIDRAVYIVPGTTVWFLDRHNVKKGEVLSVEVDVDRNNHQTVIYGISADGVYPNVEERVVFESEEEVLDYIRAGLEKLRL